VETGNGKLLEVQIKGVIDHSSLLLVRALVGSQSKLSSVFGITTQSDDKNQSCKVTELGSLSR
jgi:hypothetical protein